MYRYCLQFVMQPTTFMLVAVFMLADFGEVTCVLLLANLATYSGNTNWWKKVDTHHDGDNTY